MKLRAAVLFAAALSAPGHAQDLVVASKNFTESRLLAEIVAQLIEARTDLEVEHKANLGGTVVCWEALLAGEVDLYVEYTGTAWAVLLKESGAIADPLQTFLHVQSESRRRFDVEWLPGFGLNNTYAMALDAERAAEWSVTRISDLAKVGNQVRAGFSVEFINREDGWLGMRQAYTELGFEPRGMEHTLAYGALERGELDLIDAYSTDGKLAKLDVVTLEDDLGFFPPYNAAPIVRGASLERFPELRDVLWPLAFAIDDERARDLNARVEVDGRGFEEVALEFLREAGLLDETASADPGGTGTSRIEAGLRRLPGLLLQHIGLVLLSVLLAALIAIPLGLFGARRPGLKRALLGFASVMQTVPSLALLAFLIALPGVGLGAPAAIVALVLYAVLPILRNTSTGLDTVDPALLEAARGMGLSPSQVLWRIQLPIAARTILAGLRTAAVISVGVATLAAFIGAGGLGAPIVEGLYLNDTRLILLGAVPAALLALSVDALLAVLERYVTPRGLR
ncbi:MAG: glycine betaine ABC transporter substrate-binding protein [Planctomycetota bacterium]